MADRQKGVISCHLSFDGEIWKAVCQTKEQKTEYIEELLSLYTQHQLYAYSPAKQHNLADLTQLVKMVKYFASSLNYASVLLRQRIR